jgi:hypothetical protein
MAGDDCFILLETIIDLKGEKALYRAESGESPDLAGGGLCGFF